MIRPRHIAGGALAVFGGFVVAQASAPRGYMPPAGFVPDSITAVRIAEAVWIPIYGESSIRSERPFRATLAGGVWTVQGSLPRSSVGGVAIAEIAKADARIIRVSHGK